MKFVCTDCRRIFTEDEVERIKTSYEYEYGVAGLVNSRTRLTKLTCPICGELVEEFVVHEHYDYEDALDYVDFKEVVDIMEDLYDEDDETNNNNILFELFKDEWEEYLSSNST